MARITFEKTRARFLGSGNREPKDISVSLSKGGTPDTKIGTVYFRGDSQKKLAADCAYITIEIDTDLERMYFVPSDRIHGYKLSVSQNAIVRTLSCGMQLRGANIEAWDPFVGDFDLVYDKSEKLWYIDAKAKA